MAYQAGYGHLAQMGRVREGRVDTGTHFIDNVQDIQVGCLINGLQNVGYQVTHCHWFLQTAEPPKTDKFVVVVGLGSDDQTKGGVTALEMSNKTLQQRRILTRTCWQWCHGWANPNGVITLNFGGRKPDGRPRNAVVVRDRKIWAAKAQDFIAEEDEVIESEKVQ